jgi:hypothetical protein
VLARNQANQADNSAFVMLIAPKSHAKVRRFHVPFVSLPLPIRMAGVILIVMWFILPVLLGSKICEDRNRDQFKGGFLGLVFGWFAVIGMWLALKRRDPKTHQLY